MKITTMTAIAAAALATTACTTMDDGMASADTSADIAYVDGAAMYSNRTIVENAVNSPIHNTLVAAVQAADLVDTLNSAGPFTVFAPSDDAFAALPAGTVDTLLMPQNKAALSGVLTYHVVPGQITAADIAAQIAAGGGSATYTTVAGEALTFSLANGGVMIAGMGGSSAMVEQADIMQSNGVIHSVSGVLLPTM